MAEERHLCGIIEARAESLLVRLGPPTANRGFADVSSGQTHRRRGVPDAGTISNPV